METLTELKSGAVFSGSDENTRFYFDIGPEPKIIILEAWVRANIFLKPSDPDVSNKIFTWKSQTYRMVKIEIDPSDKKYVSNSRYYLAVYPRGKSTDFKLFL